MVYSVLGVDLDHVVFGVAEEQRPVPPLGQVGRFSEDGHALGDQFGMAGVHGRGRHPEGKLDGRGPGYRGAVVPGRSLPSWPQRPSAIPEWKPE